MSIPSRSSVSLGVVPTHVKFVGGIVPDEQGKLPRDPDGQLVMAAEMGRLCAASRVRIDAVQITAFPGTAPDDLNELLELLKALGLEVQLVLMIGGANPMDPADEDAVVGMLVDGLNTAKAHGITTVGSTSIEEWMKEGATRREGTEFAAAVAQIVKVHLRSMREAGLDDSCVRSWHVEFLRPGEFHTFTDLGRVREIIRAANSELGRPFFKALVDAAHCGDSSLSIAENETLIAELAAADELGCFHASAKTTRGCLTTDDGWIGALLSAAAKTGKLEHVFVELFHHEDPALEGLRHLDPGHGVDTTDGRSYTQTVIDGLTDTAHRLNNLVARGILPAR